MQNYQYEVRYPSLTEGVFRFLILFTITYLIQLIATIFSVSYDSLILFSGNNFNILSLFTHFFIYPVSLSGFFQFFL
ncbi:MAG: hypothetical protein KatS3mg129_2776 [Leptospiraceae bacterium]|nr:MAG: hypothetical protein KatS3mg129_2776 [Leptospiraceae bacterium]